MEQRCIRRLLSQSPLKQAIANFQRSILSRWQVLSALGMLFLVNSAGADQYGDSVADYLNYRPHVTDPDVAESVLGWGNEQGISGLQGGTPAERETRRTAVHELIAQQYLPGIVLPHAAPDAGVRVQVGQPKVVMFGPEGNVEDNAGNVERLGFERFGNYMFSSIYRLRDDKLLVRVYVGAEDDRWGKPHEWLNYLSTDRGNSWQHIVCYDKVELMASQASERPITEAAFRLGSV